MRLPFEQITRAAVRINGHIFAPPRPGRHGDAIQMAVEAIPDCFVQPDQQGFVTNYGRFVDRVEGKYIARRANQLLERASKLNELFSEDMW